MYENKPKVVAVKTTETTFRNLRAIVCKLNRLMSDVKEAFDKAMENSVVDYNDDKDVIVDRLGDLAKGFNTMHTYMGRLTTELLSARRRIKTMYLGEEVEYTITYDDSVPSKWLINGITLSKQTDDVLADFGVDHPDLELPDEFFMAVKVEIHLRY